VIAVAPGAPVLAAKALTVGYAGRTVIDAADLSVAPGERLALVGPNGAGKSSLLRALTGVLAPRAGSIDLLGEAVDQVPRKKLARTIAVVPELADPVKKFANLLMDIGAAATSGAQNSEPEQAARLKDADATNTTIAELCK